MSQKKEYTYSPERIFIYWYIIKNHKNKEIQILYPFLSLCFNIKHDFMKEYYIFSRMIKYNYCENIKINDEQQEIIDINFS